MFVIVNVLLSRLPHFVKSVVGDLQDPPGGDDTVGRFQVAVTVQVCLLQINHSLDEVVHQGGDEHGVQFNVVILQNVLM